MATQTRAKFGYLNYEAMLLNIAQETDPKRKLDAYDLNFTPDTKECYIIAPDLTPWSIKSKVYTFDNINLAVEQLNQNNDTYAGQIIAIKSNEKYYGYIVNPASGGWSVSPLSEQIGEIDYNTIGNRPIKNIYGEIEKPVIVSDLNNGIYTINGQYQISPDINTILSSATNHIVIVEHGADTIHIKRITADDITDYSIANNTTTISKIVTSDFLQENGYITAEEVDIKIAALDAVSRSEVTEYIKETVLANLDNIIDEKIDTKLDEKIIAVDNTEIEALF